MVDVRSGGGSNVGLGGEPLRAWRWVSSTVGFADWSKDGEEEAAEAMRMLELMGQACTTSCGPSPVEDR